MNALRRIAGSIHIQAMALYLLATLVLTWPLASRFATHVPGTDIWAFDEYTFVWNLWWFKFSLLDLGTNPLHSSYTFFPVGISLVLYTYNLFNALLGLPLQMAFDVVVTSNLMFIASFVLAAYGTFLLIRYLLRTKRLASDRPWAYDMAALVGGLAYAFTASRFVYASLGHYNFLSSHWMPFYILFFIRTVRGRRMSDPVLAGLFATFNLLSEMTLGVFLALFTVLYLLFAGRRRVLRWDFVRRIAVMAGVTLVSYAPVLYSVLKEMMGTDFALPGWGHSESLLVDLMGFFAPTALHSLWGIGWKEELVAVAQGTGRFTDVHTVYVGFVLALLALFASVKYGRRLWVWWATVLASAVFCLGPLLHINGKSAFDFDGLAVNFPMPFILLHYLPVIKINRVPNRFSLIMMLALAVLASYALAYLLSRLKGRWWAGGAAAMVGLVMLAETISIPLPLTDATIPSFYRELGRDAEDYAVLQLPLGWRNSFGTQGAERTQLQFYQTAHHKRMLGGNISRNPPFKLDYFQQVPLFQSIMDLEFYRDVDDARKAQDAATAPDLLYLYDIRYLVAHSAVPGRLPYADTKDRTLAYLEEVLPLELVAQGEDVVAYRTIQPEPRDELSVDFGDPATRMYRGEGWSREEEVAGATANWAIAQGARLFFPLRDVHLQDDGGCMVTVGALPFSYDQSPTQTLTLRVNGTWASEFFPMVAAWAPYSAPVPAWALRPGLNELTLDFGYLASPHDVLPGDFAVGATGVWSPVDITVQSAMDSARITIGEEDVSWERRGYNIAAVDPASGEVLDVQGFDTYANEHESRNMAAFVQELPPGAIVVVALREGGAHHLTEEAVTALASIGAAHDLRGTTDHAHAIIGVKGASPGTAAEGAGPGNFYLHVGSNSDDRTLAVAVDFVQIQDN
jgi:hypothetical protein